jgi:hypothetical protein
MTRNLKRAAWQTHLVASAFCLALGSGGTAAFAAPLAYDSAVQAATAADMVPPQDAQASLASASELPSEPWAICACFTMVDLEVPFEFTGPVSGPTPFAVPEPGALALLGLGLGAFGIALARRRPRGQEHRRRG